MEVQRTTKSVQRTASSSLKCSRELQDARRTALRTTANYELPQGGDFFSYIHNFRKTKQILKPKPAPESPRPGAADSRGKTIKSALAGLGS
jgi:hypothetical protein